MKYDLQYRETGARPWRTDAPRNVAGLSVSLDGLDPDTEYEVQVLARSDEGASGWSTPPTLARTGDNGPPVFAEHPRTTRSVDGEHGIAPAHWAGGVGGRPGGRRSDLRAAGPGRRLVPHRLRDRASCAPARRSTTRRRRAYDVDGEGRRRQRGRDGDDRGEGEGRRTWSTKPPETPEAPTVEGSGTSLSVRWIAPENTGPPMAYDLQYRETGGSWTERPAQGVPGRSATIGGLAPDTDYEARVLARNDEGASGWSASGRGRTDGGERRLYMADVTVLRRRNCAEFTIVFSPAQVGRRPSLVEHPWQFAGPRGAGLRACTSGRRQTGGG